MKRKLFRSISILVSSAIVILSVESVQAQTPRQIAVRDQPGTGACNNAGGNDCIDSVITQAGGNIGIGTTAPVPTPQGRRAKASDSQTTQASADSGDSESIPSEYKGDVDLLIGIGSQIVSPSASNYQIVNNAVIQELNLGSATPQIMTGLSFKLPLRMFRKSVPNPSANVDNTWMAYPWHAFVSFKFTPGSQNALDGYVVGMTYRVAKYLDLLGGYTLTPVDEISPGFQAIAIQTVTSDPSAYPTFYTELNKLMTNSKHAFDGFPLQKQGGQGNLFAGNPLTTHYRGGLIIGVAFPISLNGVFASQKSPNESGSKLPK